MRWLRKFFFSICKICTELLLLFSYMKNKKTYLKRTSNYTHYDKNIWVICYSSIKVVLFDN